MKKLIKKIKYYCKYFKSLEYYCYIYYQIRYLTIPRYKKQKISFFHYDFEIADMASFVSAFREIYVKHIYKFNIGAKNPLIIDCGANIGLSVIYFKRLYPNARVIAFEPDPEIFKVLKRNIEVNKISDVSLLERAVWKEETTLEFVKEGGDGGRIKKECDEENIIKVKTVRLKDFLNDQIAFLKIDIEGAETEVILDAIDSFRNIKYIFIEYHSFHSQKQVLAELLKVIQDNGFRIHIQTVFYSDSPFYQLNVRSGMDNQLNIYCWKNEEI